jgi:hypothetical protein
MTTTCANHTGTPANAFCRTCGKPLCEECKRDVRGVIYCEECIAARLQDTIPPIDPRVAGVAPRGSGLPNPTLAAFLGVIPGVGAFYNGQYQKGVAHVLGFVALIALTDRFDAFGIAFPFYFLYMIWDAYKTARARITGEPVPDPLGINNLFGMESAAVKANTPGIPGAAPPLGAIILIGLGVLFLLGDIEPRIAKSFLPMIMIVWGLWKGASRWQVQ